MLCFDGVICDSDGIGFVPMDLCFWMRVAQLFESHSKHHALFAVKKEGAEFGFGNVSNDNAKNGTYR
jgi:hypothetical protein